MEALAYFLLWAALLFLMFRFGCGAHILGRQHGNRDAGDRSSAGATALRWTPPETDRDPVCGKTIRPENARPSVYDGTVFYFCSRECREIFEAAPQLYLGAEGSTTMHAKEKSDD